VLNCPDMHSLHGAETTPLAGGWQGFCSAQPQGDTRHAAPWMQRPQEGQACPANVRGIVVATQASTHSLPPGNIADPTRQRLRQSPPHIQSLNTAHISVHLISRGHSKPNSRSQHAPCCATDAMHCMPIPARAKKSFIRLLTTQLRPGLAGRARRTVADGVSSAQPTPDQRPAPGGGQCASDHGAICTLAWSMPTALHRMREAAFGCTAADGGRAPSRGVGSTATVLPGPK
jgi:hypothetical protein